MLHACGGIRIVDRYIGFVKPLYRISVIVFCGQKAGSEGRFTLMGADLQSSGLKNRRKGVAIAHDSRRGDLWAGAGARTYRRQIVYESLILLEWAFINGLSSWT